MESSKTLQWRHNRRDGVSNHQPPECLLNRLFRRRSKKTSNIRVTGLCAGNSPVTGGRWIPRTNGQYRGKCFHLMTSSWIYRRKRPCTKDPEPCLNIKAVFPVIGIPNIKMRQSWDSLIFIMGIPILVRHLYIVMGPRTPRFKCM